MFWFADGFLFEPEGEKQPELIFVFGLPKSLYQQEISTHGLICFRELALPS